MKSYLHNECHCEAMLIFHSNTIAFWWFHECFMVNDIIIQMEDLLDFYLVFGLINQVKH